MPTADRLHSAEAREPTPGRLGDLELENERLRRAVTELSVLNDLARAIGASRDLDDVLHRIVSQSIRSLHAQEGVITLVEATRDGTRTLAREVVSCADVGSFHMRGAVLGWIQIHQQPLRIDDPERDDRFVGVDWEPGITSLLAVPLVVKGDLTGVLAMYNKQGSSKFDSDDQRLLAIIASQSAQVIENARLYIEERKLERVNEQIRLAADVQLHLLPDIVPSIEGYDVAGTSVAAEVVGGDYYDVIPLEDGRIALCLGDVSGKGLPASLLMANVQSMVRLMSALGFPSSRTMQEANELLCRCTSGNRFVTFFLAILDPSTGELEFCNAGHNPPVLISSDGSCERLTTSGAVLGMLPAFDYQSGHVSLGVGDGLVMFSDGVTEALNPDDDEFGEEQLIDLLGRSCKSDASAILRHILEAIRRHAAERSQSDDITILAMKRARPVQPAGADGGRP